MGTSERLEMAEALLAKARSTPFRPERTSFAAGAYEQLARYLASADVEARPAPPCIDLRDPLASATGIGGEDAVGHYRSGSTYGRSRVGARVDIVI